MTLMTQAAGAISTSRRCGAIAGRGASVTWRLWAPFAKRADLVLIGADGQRVTLAMGTSGDGYFEQTQHVVPDGQLYAYKLDGGEERADPCSLWQPQGVPGPSAVVRTDAFEWTDQGWKGVARQDLIVYELHVGTFTRGGTFEAIIPRLADLRDLGVTAIEIMPVNQFPGSRNWGYDGVLPYAAQNTYGGPRGLQKLVDAAHAAGLAVVLDVVYNHFGPESNFLHEFGPYLTDKYKTPWGKAVNFDDKGSDPVRDFVLDNARMWLEEFHFDGLRLDAVHAIYDMGARHILRAVSDVAADVAERNGRQITIIGESDLNDPRVVLPPGQGGWGLDAQWSDDFHHAVHALLTGERRGYYQDYGEAAQLAKILNNPFMFSWDYSPHRGRKHGAPLPEGLGGDHFVVCIQNHDQVGNRARGDRITELVDDPRKWRLAASLMLFSPYLPMLWMGEEYGETRPFPFFCSFAGPDLVQAVREGRKREFADFLGAGEQIPDPDAAETFESARLTWSWPAGSPQAGLRRMYQDLLAARKRWPALREYVRRAARLLPNADILELLRGGTEATAAETAHVFFNLSDRTAPLPTTPTGRLLFSSEFPEYLGGRRDGKNAGELLPFECVAFGPAEWQS